MALPQYEWIATDLRSQIVRGELAPGDTLPAEGALAEQWGVARSTVKQALGLLRNEGLVESRQGVGTWVRERLPLARTAGERYDCALRTGRVYPAGEQADILAADVVEAPDHVAAGLGLQPRALVVRRHRVTNEDARPVATSWSFFHAAVADLAPRLLEKERIHQGTTRYLEQRTFRRPKSARDMWTSRLATAEERALLDLQDPSAVTEVRHITYDANGVPLAYEVGVTPAGRWARTEEYPLGR
ncbi:GntR family transcriptional regulator [Allostreptomyces psammosilenae]|uniref:GntR family transcriptional regulator n=1 Tax=Allostreptomyces psammosilenae TaxID=1892865 RepID=A0A853A167_9ACTN|nr:GntR family transcriptional regulator [Allostreptomyces psammosilenae]NYI04252.1 GntR family transcriptional regulator [Allostreptomyces psammosilenae]